MDGERQERWTPAEARQMLAAWKKSGLSMSAFAMRRGVRADRLAWWRKRLRDWNEEKAPALSAGLVPALITGAPLGASAQAVVRLPLDVAIEVMDVAAVSPEWVSAVARELSRAR